MAEIYLVPHFHCDPVWIADQNMYQEGGDELPKMTRHPLGFLDLVRAYLDCCKKDEEYAILLSELDYLKPYWDIYPEDRSFIRYLVARRRLDLGGSYSEPNENSIGEEALVRNILYGRIFHQLQLGANPTVYLPLDVFGHTIQLSQILRKSEFSGCVWSKRVIGLPPVFSHMSLDGSTLPHRRVDYGGHFQNIDVLKEDLSLRFEELKSMRIDIDLRFIGGDSDPPTQWLTEKIKELKENKIPIILSGPARYISMLRNKLDAGRFRIPYSSRDMAFYHIGTSLSRIELKIANRLGEINLLKGERFATIASLFGAEYPHKALDKAWRQLLFNQHHDAITGTSGDKPYVDLMMGYRESLRLSKLVLDGSLQYLVSLINTKGKGIPIVVFNSLNWRRSDVCKVSLPKGTYKMVDNKGDVHPSFEIEKGNKTEVIFRGDNIPPLGYRVFFAIPTGEKEEIIKDKGTIIENEFYRIEIEPSKGGVIKSLIYKGREFVKEERGMNEILILKEDPERKEPSWEVYTTGKKISSSEFPAEVEREKNRLYERLTIKGKISNVCEYRQTITLYKGIERIGFVTDIIDYKKRDPKDDMFAVIFPTTLDRALPTFEDRFGALTRRKSKGYLDFRTWQWRNYSECGIYPAYRWMDLGPSVTVRVGTTSVSVGITDIIIPHSRELEDLVPLLLKFLANKGITASIMYDDNDSGRRSKLLSEDSTLPPFEEDIFATFKISIGLPDNIYIDRLLSELPKDAAERFKEDVKKKGYGILLTEENSIPVLIVSGKDIHSLTDAIERIGKDLEDRIIDLSPEEGYISCREVPSYGLTLINKGNISNTVENDGTMVMLLQHTARWSGKHFDFDLIPEEGTHRFVYALYPHEDTWAKARSYRKAIEFNFILDGIVTSQHNGQLPQAYSFIDLGDSDIILTALKFRGTPVAGPIDSKKDEDVIIRVYEPAGREASFEIQSCFPILRMYQMDLTEKNIALIKRFNLTPFSIETYSLSLKKRILGYVDYDITAEPHQPVYVRYWRNNAGASPIGNLPIVASLRKEEEKIVLYIANDLLDKDVSGEILLRAFGIGLDRDKVEFTLSPGAYIRHEIATFRGETSGIIESLWEYGGQSYKDTFILGKINSLDVSLKDGLISIYNPNQFEVEGEIILGTPIELWGEDLVEEFSFGNLSERFNFYCAPNSSCSIEVDYRHPKGWSIIKLAYMGNTLYLKP